MHAIANAPVPRQIDPGASIALVALPRPIGNEKAPRARGLGGTDASAASAPHRLRARWRAAAAQKGQLASMCSPAPADAAGTVATGRERERIGHQAGAQFGHRELDSHVEGRHGLHLDQTVKASAIVAKLLARRTPMSTYRLATMRTMPLTAIE